MRILRTGDGVGMDRIVLAGDDGESREIARRLVRARLRAESLPIYPGARPQTMDAGYASQDAAIELWPSTVAGWKVGRIPDEWLARMGEERLVGPIFADAIQTFDAGTPARFEVIEGGFAAVEAEFVFRLGADAPAHKTTWSEDEAAELVDALMIGIELAGSPMAMINVWGPAVVVSDFGNNAGLVLGPTIPGWRDQTEDALLCETFIDDRSVGTGRASSISGGTLAALRFALARCARRGLPLKAGQLVSTGAATGIHDIRAGQRARVEFPGIGTIHCEAVPARARSAA